MTIDAARRLMTESLRIAEDFEFWVRLSREFRFASLKAPQILYRLHASNISFDSAGDPAGNAPMLIHAYSLMLGYPGLQPWDRRRLRSHVASAYFDWAYRCRISGRFREAVSFHLRSASFGLVAANVLALAKLPLAALIGASSKTGG